MNDPAEADLHERLQDALGRTPGNPLLVVSQKTVTGHAKGGAAAWQLDGVLRMLETGVVPGNRNLESVDPLEREHAHLTLGDRPIQPRRAAQGRADHLARLRPRLRGAGDRAPGHVPRRVPSRSARGLPAPRRPPPRRGRPAPPGRAPRPPAARSAARTRRGPATTRPRRLAQTLGLTRSMIGVDLVDVPGSRSSSRHARAGSSTARSPRREQRTAKGDARRLAARFAAKEAFVKAWSGSRRGQPPLLARSTCARSRSSTTGTGAPGCGCTARSRARSAPSRRT